MFTSILTRLRGPLFEKYISVMACAGHSIFYLQTIKILQVQSSHAVSASGFLVSFFCVLSWLLYGVAKNIKPLIISNIFGLVGAALVLIAIFIYRD